MEVKLTKEERYRLARLERSCQMKWCKTGLEATISVNENMDDASYNVGICQTCADKLNLKNGDDMPEYDVVKRKLHVGEKP